MLCDGDSKAFDAVNSQSVYGAEKPITKEDCINHVSKRMKFAWEICKETRKCLQGRAVLLRDKKGIIDVSFDKLALHFAQKIPIHQEIESIITLTP